MARNSQTRRFGTQDLMNAGASDAFVSMYLSAAEGRHSVKEELNSGYGGDILAKGEDPSRVGGGFFKRLWDGDVFKAFLHADGSNTKLMLEVFGPERILREAVGAGNGLDYSKRMVNQKASRYGYAEV